MSVQFERFEKKERKKVKKRKFNFKNKTEKKQDAMLFQKHKAVAAAVPPHH